MQKVDFYKKFVLDSIQKVTIIKKKKKTEKKDEKPIQIFKRTKRHKQM